MSFIKRNDFWDYRLDPSITNAPPGIEYVLMKYTDDTIKESDVRYQVRILDTTTNKSIIKYKRIKIKASGVFSLMVDGYIRREFSSGTKDLIINIYEGFLNGGNKLVSTITISPDTNKYYTYFSAISLTPASFVQIEVIGDGIDLLDETNGTDKNNIFIGFYVSN